MVNFAAEGPSIAPDNETWRPPGAFGHQWGMRGEAWLDSHFFSEDLDYIDLNVTRAVQASQLPGVQSYHRRVFANWADGGAYLLWDVIDAPPTECAQATLNLHVLTQLGWPGKAGCKTITAPESSTDSPRVSTHVECDALNDKTLDVSIIRPSAADRRLLSIEADPLPIQFTGMTGSALPEGSVPNMPSVGGAFGGDWNADGGIAPEDAHWPARTPTWLRVKGAPDSREGGDEANSGCEGFLTLLYPRNDSVASLEIKRVDELPDGAVTVETSSPAGNTIYMLSSRAAAYCTLNGPFFFSSLLEMQRL